MSHLERDNIAYFQGFVLITIIHCLIASMWEFFLPPPQKKTVTQYFLKGPIKVLECVDIIFLGQFDVPEHVFNIGLMMRPLLEALWAS